MSNFKTKARAIELLGRKQIRDSVTALAELMKNSYDADAPWLRVEFNTQNMPNHIIISDGGLGMNKADIENKWLVLGTNSKTSNAKKQSPDGRPLMGAKGIGRLASARLGKQLWLITKNLNSNWNIVYINWDIFENPHISLDEIDIPSLFDVSKDELLVSFNSIVEKLIFMQKNNLKLPGWYEINGNGEKVIREDCKELFHSIETNINNCSISSEKINKFLFTNQGTILFVDALNDFWGKYLAPVSESIRSNDVISDKNYKRFAAFVSTFKHAAIKTIPFNVEVYVDNNIWDEDFSFVEEDYNIYDIKLDGFVEKGKFFGKLFALNADEELLEKCNVILTQGIEVTRGILNWQEIDCGRYRIKLCHLEEKPSSGLNEDDYSRISRKLDVACGISIFRDNVRILPYGEPENDFLNIEERRSKNAGNYIFSHRNIFGRIDIDSNNNPKLEDKSSREGLIENDQYYYFVTTIINLLTDIAYQYLSTARKNSYGIRKTLVEHNKRVKEENEHLKNIKIEEKKRANEIIKEFKKRLFDTNNILEMIKTKVDEFCEHNIHVKNTLSITSGYNRISAEIARLREQNQYIETFLNESISKCANQIPLRYEHYFDEKMKIEILESNERLNKANIEFLSKIRESFSETKSFLEEILAQWTKEAEEFLKENPNEYKKTIEDRLSFVIGNCRNQLDEVLMYLEDNVTDLISDIADIEKTIEDINSLPGKAKNKKAYLNIDSKVKQVATMHERIQDLFNGNPQTVYQKGTSFLIDLEKMYNDIINDTRKLRYEFSEEISNYNKIVSKLMQINNDEISDEIFGLIRQENVRLQVENDIYSDLASLGLASEIVNHEFNQLFSNVSNAIKHLYPYIKDNNSMYWLRQIEVGFRAISDRQNQLSPMYRSYSLRKREIGLKSFVDGVCRFMENMIKQDNIVVENLINDDIVISISPSKIFPVISNLLNNSIYWVKDREKKLIRIRYDNECMYIEDSGPGITAYNKESVFEPFVSYKPNGRGLGLAIARKVLESQGYTIEIASDTEKTLSGACFRINLCHTKEGK